MTNPFLLSPQGRLEHWKNFRKILADKTESDQIVAVGRYWSVAPLFNIAYDCEAPQTWPTLWEMISKGDWCRNSVAIGMEGTLRLMGIQPERLTLGLMLDQDISDMMMCVKIDSTWLLNYSWSLVTPYPSTKHRWLREYRWIGKKYIEI